MTEIASAFFISCAMSSGPSRAAGNAASQGAGVIITGSGQALAAPRFCCPSGFFAVQALLLASKALAQQAATKLERVVVFGSVRNPFLHSGLSMVAASSGRHDFFLRPDPSHGLFSRALDAAERALRRLQELGVRLTVVSRHAAYEGAGSPALYDNLARMNANGLRGLRDSQRASLEALFAKVSAPLGSADRGKKGRLTGVRQSDKSRIGQQLQAQPDP